MMDMGDHGAVRLFLKRLVVFAEARATFDLVQWFWECAASGEPVCLRRLSREALSGPGTTARYGACARRRSRWLHVSVLFWEAESAEVEEVADNAGIAVLPAADKCQDSDAGLDVLGIVTSRTALEFAYRSYRVTFSLDISPSVAIVDDTGSTVVAQRLFNSLETCVSALSQPILFASTNGDFSVEHTPDVYVSVIAQGSLQEAYKVLLQGAHLCAKTRRPLLRELRRQTQNLESEYKAFYSRARNNELSVHGVSSQDDPDDEDISILRSSTRQTHPQGPRFMNTSLYLATAAEVALETALRQRARTQGSNSADYLAESTVSSHSTSLVQHINDGVFALQQLPVNARSCLVLITDAVAQLPESCSAYGGMITLLNREKIPCSVVQVPVESAAVEAPFGFVAHGEAMRYVASSTGGSFFSISDRSQSRNIREKLFVDPYRFSGESLAGPTESFVEGSSVEELASLRVASYELPIIPMEEILRLRYFDGFHPISVQGETHHTETYRFCWHHDIFVLYHATKEQERIKVDLTLQGPRMFLSEFVQLLRRSGSGRKSPLVHDAREFLMALREVDRQFSSFYGKLADLLNHARTDTGPVDRCRRFWELLQGVGARGQWHNVELSDSIDLLLSADDTPHMFNSTNVVDPPLPDIAPENLRWKKGETVQSRRQQHLRFLASLTNLSDDKHRVIARDSFAATAEAMRVLDDFLQSWSSFVNPSKNAFVRYLTTAGTEMSKSSGFAVVHVERLTERFLTLHIAMYAASSELILATLEDLRSRLRLLMFPDTKRTRSVVGLFEKPVRALLVNYDWNTDTHARLFRFQSMQPTFPLLRAYLRRRRWAWHLPMELRAAALTLMSHARTHVEGFVCTHTSPYMAFVKQASLLSTSVSCILQYVCYTIPAPDTAYCKLVYEFWMEPQWGSSEGQTGDQFSQICDWIADADLRVVSALYSFHALAQHAIGHRQKVSSEGKTPTYSLSEGPEQAISYLRKPQFSLENLLACARIKHTFRFTQLEWGEEEELTAREGFHRQLARVHADILLRSLELLVDFVLPNSDVSPKSSSDMSSSIVHQLGVQDSLCFGKVVDGARGAQALVLIFVRKLDPIDPVRQSCIELLFVECGTPAEFPPRSRRKPPAGLCATQHSDHRDIGLQETPLKKCSFPTQLLGRALQVEGDRALVSAVYSVVRDSWRELMSEQCPLLQSVDSDPILTGHDSCPLALPEQLLGRVLGFCEERRLSVEISEYLRIAQAQHQGTVNLEDTPILEKLMTLVSHAFVPITPLHNSSDVPDKRRKGESVEVGKDLCHHQHRTRYIPGTVFAFAPQHDSRRTRCKRDPSKPDELVTDVFGVTVGSDDEDAQITFGEPSEEAAMVALGEYELPEVPACLVQTTSKATARDLVLFGHASERATIDWSKVSLPGVEPVHRVSLSRGLRHLPFPIDSQAMSSYLHPFFFRITPREEQGRSFVDLEVISFPERDNVETETPSSVRGNNVEHLPRALRRVLRTLESNIGSLLSEEILHSLRVECVSVAETPVEDGSVTLPDTSATEGFMTDASASLVTTKPFRNELDVTRAEQPLADTYARITRQTLDLVLHHLRRVHKRSVSAFTIPLTLMPDTEAAALFLEELSNMHSVHANAADLKRLSLRRFEGGYFVMDRWRDTQSAQTERPFTADNPDESRTSDHRLGSASDSASSTVRRDGPESVLPFWLVLQMIESNETLKVWFHSATMSRVEKSGIFSTLRASVRSVCDRVNQVALLQQMHEQRVVSELISPSETSGARAGDSRERSIKVRHHVFRPGQFACPLVHRMVLPLHARLPVVRALSILSDTTLNPFQVTSRANFFVIREKAGHVFYMSMFGDGDAGDGEESRGMLPRSDSSASLTSGADVSERDGEFGKAARLAFVSGVRSVVIEVFGVDEPGPEITVQLYKLIDAKLASLTLQTLSELLIRNPHFKLTAEDISFIRGSEFPKKTLSFALPTFIEDRFFALLRQTLLNSVGAKLHRETTSQTDTLPENWREFQDDFFVCTRQSGEVAILLMIHSCPGEAENVSVAEVRDWLRSFSALEAIDDDSEDEDEFTDTQSDTRGRDESGRDVPNRQREPTPRRTQLNTDLLSSEEDTAELSTRKFEPGQVSHVVEFSIWGREGFFQFDTLTQTITRCINHALNDYAIEYWLDSDDFNQRVSVPILQGWLNPVSDIVKRALLLDTPTFKEIVKPVDYIPAWNVHSFVKELRGCMDRLCNGLQPVMQVIDTLRMQSAPVSKSIGKKPAKKKREGGNDLYRSLTRSAPLTMDVIDINDAIEVAQQEISDGPSENRVTWHDLLAHRPKHTFAVVGGLSVDGNSSDPEQPFLDDRVMFYGLDSDVDGGTVKRSIFACILVSASALTIRLYNWSSASADELLESISELQRWQFIRQQLLDSILLQKLGNFELQKPEIETSYAIHEMLQPSLSAARGSSERSREGSFSSANNRQQQVLALMRRQQPALGRAAPQSVERVGASKITLSIANMKRLVIQTSPIGASESRALVYHSQLLHMRGRWVPSFGVVYAHAFPQRSSATALLRLVGQENSVDPVQGHGEQLLESAFSQARSIREGEREAHVLRTWLRSCQSPLRRSDYQHPEHFRYVIKASQLQWSVCVPWLLGMKFSQRDRAEDTIPHQFLEKFASECAHTLGLSKIRFGINDQPTETGFVVCLQRFHAGGLMIICAAFHSQVVSLGPESRHVGDFVEARCFTLENSLIQTNVRDVDQPDPTEVALTLFAKLGEDGTDQLSTFAHIAKKQAAHCVLKSRINNMEANGRNQEQRLRIDAARYLRVLRVRALVFDFHVLAAIDALCPAPGAQRESQILIESASPQTFREFFHLLCSIVDVFPEFCSSEPAASTYERSPDTCMLSVSISVPLNPSNVALPPEVFRFLQQHAGRYGLVSVRAADALIISDSTIQSALSAHQRLVEPNSEPVGFRFCALVLPEADKDLMRVDRLRLHLFVLQVPIEIEWQGSSPPGLLSQALSSISEWFNHTVHSALLHLQRELLFSKLLAGRHAETGATPDSPMDRIAVPSSPVREVSVAASPSFRPHDEVEPLTVLSSIWSPQIIRSKRSRPHRSKRPAPPKARTLREDNMAGLTQQEFDTLMSLSVCVPAETLDARTKDLFGCSDGLHWHDVLVDILRAYGLENARELSWRRGEHHFIILNTLQRDANCFIHVEFRAADNAVQISSCSLLRPDEFLVTSEDARFALDSNIRNQLEEFVNQLLHLLYKRILEEGI